MDVQGGACNEFLDLKKNQSRETILDEDILVKKDLSDQLIDHYIENEQVAWLYRQIRKLPQQEREVLLLTVRMEYSDVHISDILRLSVSNVRVLRHRAKKISWKK